MKHRPFSADQSWRLAVALAFAGCVVVQPLPAAAQPKKQPAAAMAEPKAKLNNAELVDAFTELYFRSNAWQQSFWFGVPALQNPFDQWVMQEIIAELRPDFIIETGTFKGGSTLYYAMLLDGLGGDGRVITIDVTPDVAAAAKFPVFQKRVEVITGSSTDAGVVKRIADRVKGRKVMVTLDSLHTKAHVLDELRAYAPLVSKGSYLVVQDTFIHGHPVDFDFGGPGPMEAVEEFLKTHPEFGADRSREKFLMTFYPSGYLKKTQ